jgi:dephospho-CoA kinase
MSLCVGLTGGIGSGKSTVARLFAERGAGIVDTDVISHQLTQAHGVAMPLILAHFGSAYVDEHGALNRRAMRELIFANPQAKRDLEALLHPIIIAQAQAELAACTTQPYTLLVCPLLFENPRFQQPIQRVLVVDCPETLQVERVMQRSQLSAEAVLSIIAQQTPRTEKICQADDIICNDQDLNHLIRHVNRLHENYMRKASQTAID